MVDLSFIPTTNLTFFLYCRGRKKKKVKEGLSMTALLQFLLLLLSFASLGRAEVSNRGELHALKFIVIKLTII